MKRKQILAIVLAASLAASSAVPACAADAVAANAIQSTTKEEVIYINTDSDGEVCDIQTVNIFDSGNIKDYGMYTSVKNLSTNDEIIQNGDVVLMDAKEQGNNIYYQGTLDASTPIPWDIDIEYYLDDKLIDAEDLAGKKGALKIHFVVNKNPEYTGNVYENYALQANFSLDTDRCSNISAPDATIANVGTVKQMTFTMLPGKGIDTYITADVKNFKMDAVTINGLKLNLNIEINDEDLMAKVQELMNGASDINDGTQKLRDGSGIARDNALTLKTGSHNLDSGVLKLQDGIIKIDEALCELDSNSADLTSGSSEVFDALKTIKKELDKVSDKTDDINEFSKASSDIKTGIGKLYSGAMELYLSTGWNEFKAQVKEKGNFSVDEVQEGNKQMIAMIEDQRSSGSSSSGPGLVEPEEPTLEDYGGNEYAYNEAYEQYLRDLADYNYAVEQQGGSKSSTSNEDLEMLYDLFLGNYYTIEGMKEYLRAIGSNMGTLVDGLEELKTNYSDFDDAVKELTAEVKDMFVKISDLSEGINELVTEYEKLDNGINDYTDGVAQIVAAYAELTKGVSEIADGSSQLSEGSEKMYNGLSELFDGTSTLSSGTQEMADRTSGMDTEVTNQIDEMISQVQGNNDSPVSFVSDKNNNVKMVQFVIKTESIDKSNSGYAATNETDNENAKPSLWEKLCNLFAKA